MAFVEYAIFPFLTVVFEVIAFVGGYAIALGNGHVDAFLPFISDCGAVQPESSFFSQFLNMSTFCSVVTMYLIHWVTMKFYEEHCQMDISKWKKFSIAVMITGWVSAFGTSLVANFQEGPHLFIHVAGALLFFFGILFYFWGLVIIAYALKPRMVSIHLTNFRLFLHLLTTSMLALHLTSLFARPFIKRVNGTVPQEFVPPDGIVRHTMGDRFYVNWLASTIPEWLVALLLGLHVLTYTYDLSIVPILTPLSSHSSSVVKTIANEETVNQMNFQHATMLDVTPSRQRLHRPDQMLTSDGYCISPRALPRIADM